LIEVVMSVPRKVVLALVTLAVGAAVVAAAAWAAPPVSGPRPAAPQRKPKIPDEKNPQYQYEKGLIALRYGLPDEAIRYAQLALSLDPKHYDSWALLGSAHCNKGEYAPGVEAYEKALAIQPGSADILRDLGLAYIELKRADKAEAALKRSYEIKDAFETAYYLGKICYNAGRNEEALGYALKSIQKNGQNAGAYNLKGVVLNQLGRYAEAAGSFQAGLVLTPGDINLQVNLGIALLNSGEAAKARAVFEAVLPKIQQDDLKKQVEDYIKAIKDAGK
jgi:tetratricopeptide (TPR) repeat protein